MRKNIILLSILCSCTITTFAQNGYKSLSLSTGLSSAYLKIGSLTYENSFHKKGNFGITLDALFYNDLTNKFSLKSGITFIAMGFQYKKILGTKRNFLHNFLIAVAGGTNKKTFVYYPTLGFQQNWSLSAKSIFFISEKILYLFDLKNTNTYEHWHPSLNVGMSLAF